MYRNILARHKMALLLGLTILALSGSLAGADTTTDENLGNGAVTPSSNWDADQVPDALQVAENWHDRQYPYSGDTFNTESKRVSVSGDDDYNTGFQRWNDTDTI